MARKTAIRYELFAREYVIDLNAYRAAIAVGYSEKTARSQGSQLLTKPGVQKLIEKLNAKRASRLEITAQRLDEETAKLAFSNMKKYVRTDANGKLQGMDLSELTDDDWAAVQELREDTTGGSGDGERKVVLRTTLKLSDKLKALELLFRRQGLLTDKTQVSGLEGLGEQLALMRAKKQST